MRSCLLWTLGITALLLAGSSTALALEPAWIFNASGSVNDLSLSANGSLIAVAADLTYGLDFRGERLWNTYGSTIVHVSSDGRYLTATDGGDVGFYTKDGTQRWSDAKYLPIEGLSLSPRGDYIAYLGGVSVSLYNTSGGVKFRKEVSEADTLAVSSGGLVVVGGPQLIQAFNSRGGRQWNYTTYATVQRIQISGNGQVIVAAGYNKILALNRFGNLLWENSTPGDIRDLAITDDGKHVVAGGYDSQVTVFNATGMILWNATVGGWVNSVALSVKGPYIVAGSQDRNIYLFDSTGTLLGSYPTDGWVRSVAITTDGSLILAGTLAGTVYGFYPTLPGSTPVPTPARTGTPVPKTTSPTPVLTATTTPTRTPYTPSVVLITTTPPPLTTPKSGSLFLLVPLSLFFCWILVRKRNQ